MSFSKSSFTQFNSKPNNKQRGMSSSNVVGRRQIANRPSIGSGNSSLPATLVNKRRQADLGGGDAFISSPSLKANLPKSLSSIGYKGSSGLPSLNKSSISANQPSPYYRGPDATGLTFPPRPPSRHTNFNSGLDLLDESEEFNINKDVLDKTFDHVHYSTKMNYTKTQDCFPASKPSFKNDAELKEFRRMPSAGYHSDAEAETSPPIDNPQFKIPKPKLKVNPRIGSYKAVYGKNNSTLKEEDETSSDSSKTSSSSSSDSEESDDSSSDDEDKAEVDEAENIFRRERKALLMEKIKKEKESFKFSVENNHHTGEDSSKIKNKILKTPAGVKSHENVSESKKGFIEELHKRKSLLGNDEKSPNTPIPFTSMPMLAKTEAMKAILKTQTANSNKKTPISQFKSGSTKASLSALSNVTKTCSPSSSSVDVSSIVEDIKHLHDDVVKILPKDKKYLLGNKSTLTNLTTSSSNVVKSSSTTLRRQHTNLTSTKSGLTIYPSKNSMLNSTFSPVDDLLKESAKTEALTTNTKKNIENLKQKLGFITKASTSFEKSFEESKNVYVAAKLKLPARDTKSSKLAREQFQARDAQMVAARRQAMLNKINQNKNKYLLTDEELKKKIHRNRPSKLLNPTQGWIQRTEALKLEKFALNNVKAESNLKLQRGSVSKNMVSSGRPEKNMFKASPTIMSIPKLSTPAWKNIF